MEDGGKNHGREICTVKICTPETRFKANPTILTPHPATRLRAWLVNQDRGLILYYAQRGPLASGEEEFLASEHAPLEGQHVLQRTLLEIFPGLFGWHPRERVLDLLQCGRLSECPTPHGG